MASSEYVIGALCSECGNDFIKPFRVYNVTNTDYISSITTRLLTDKLNKVTCPRCNSTFTFELPHLAFSLNKGYAVYARYNQDIRSRLSGKCHLFEMMNIDNMKFRLVDYLCEVAEKVAIFESGLDDISVEIVKHRHFPQKYFENNSDYNLLFTGTDEEDMIFEFRNHIDTVLETHRIPLSEYIDFSEKYQPETFRDGYVVWTKIDNIYIKEICHE